MHYTDTKQRVVGWTHCVDTLIRRLCSAILILSMLPLLIGLSLNVVVRYLFQDGGLGWVAELPSLLFPWMISAGLVMAAQQGAHITIDMLTWLNDRGRCVLVLFVNILLCIAYFMLFHVINSMIEIVAIDRSPLLELPLSWAYSALSFAALATSLTSLLIVIRIILQGSAALPPNALMEGTS